MHKSAPAQPPCATRLILINQLVNFVCTYLDYGPIIHSVLHEDALCALVHRLRRWLYPYRCLTHIYRFHPWTRRERPRRSRDKLWHVHVSIKHDLLSLLLQNENPALTYSAVFLHTPSP